MVGGVNWTVIDALPAIVDVIVGAAGAPTDAGETLALNAPRTVDVVVDPGFETAVAPLVVARTLTVFTVPYVEVLYRFVAETVYVSVVPSWVITTVYPVMDNPPLSGVDQDIES